MYKSFIRPLLFLLPPETAHRFTFTVLKVLHKLPGCRPLFRSLFHIEHPQLEREIFGLKFKNPVGLAAGFDKDAVLIDEFSQLGFGFIEIGTITPKPQPGNEKPRLFRLPEDAALINRMGFNNSGMIEACEKLKSRKSDVLIGGNIGKNKNTPLAEAHNDYKQCFNQLFDQVDYFVVNVSSPNTPNLRELQEKEPLEELLRVLQEENQKKSSPKPLLLKIAPDLNHGQLDDIINISLDLKLDGIIAANTTISRDGLTTASTELEAIGGGGLSGKPLTDKSTGVISYLSQGLGQQIPIIGVGGIFNAGDALAKLRAGASLVQVYTGLIYEGPGLVKRINKAIIDEGL